MIFFFFLIGQNYLLNSKYVTVAPQGTKRLGCLRKRGSLDVLTAPEQSSALSGPPAPAPPRERLPPAGRARGGRRRQRSPGRGCPHPGRFPRSSRDSRQHSSSAEPTGARARCGHGGLARVGARRAAEAGAKQPARSERKSLG